MLVSRRNYTISSGSSPYVIDLSDIADGEKGYVNRIADFCIEVEGNTHKISIKAKGSFSNSTFKRVTDDSFAAGGGMISINGLSLSALQLTTDSTLPFSVNITRQIKDL